MFTGKTHHTCRNRRAESRYWPALSLAVVSLSLLAAVPAPTKKKIMPFGDSITQGNTDISCYRLYLDRKLTAAGYPFDFVGSLTLCTDSYSDSTYDRNHEGHYGWEADRLLPNVGGWARATMPDIVLIHAGTNDLLHETDPIEDTTVARTIRELSAIIDTFRTVNKNMIFLLAKIIPDLDASDRTNFQMLNAKIPAMAAAKTTGQSPIIVVDQWTGFNYATDLDDDYHPNQSGAVKMANKWFAKLDSLYKLPTGIENGPRPSLTNNTTSHRFQLVSMSAFPGKAKILVRETGSSTLYDLEGRPRNEKAGFKAWNFR